MNGTKSVFSRVTIPVTMLVVVFLVSTVRADFVQEQARQTADAFNAMNDGRGYYYTVTPENGRWNMSTIQGSDKADFGAYSSSVGGENYAKTFCVEPLVGTGARHYGTLSYTDGATTTQSGHSLTLGAAYLYMAFATGVLDGYNYDSPKYYEGSELTAAIQFLIGAVYDQSWYGNDFLASLLNIDADESHWKQVYDPGQHYDELGDYSVFVMNNHDEYGTHRQDFLYLAGHDENTGSPGAATPEPATMLIFGAGLAGLAMVRRRKKAA